MYRQHRPCGPRVDDRQPLWAGLRRPAWMPGPFSNDLRERVAVAVAEGRSCRAVAALFHVSPSSVVRWSQRHRTTGSAAAKPMGGVRRDVLAGHRPWLRDRIQEKPDLTLQALKA